MVVGSLADIHEGNDNLRVSEREISHAPGSTQFEPAAFPSFNIPWR